MPEDRQYDYLADLDDLAERYGYTASLGDYDKMTVAYGRGLCTEAELGKWLRWYDYASDTAFGWKGWLRSVIKYQIGVAR